jgi:hypothetical protein
MVNLEKALFDCKGKNKVHLKDQRLRVNAGMDFPVCKANAKMLDLTACWLPMTNEIELITCKACLKAYHAKRRN